ncbi:MAG: aldo/keto reductase [Prolixibacteraceae bacterium]|nr:aldo/keto reductase [Prolixibacteraceae bacterium]
MKITDINGTFTLNNGVEMPYFGLGTWQSNEGSEVKNAVKAAFDMGYKLIDTAAFYGNETSIGEAIKEYGIARDDFFLTTKLWTDAMGFDQALKAYDQSLKRLGLDYADLYLIHWPVTGKFKEAWKALEKIYKEGRVKAIGISNFLPVHLNQLLPDAEIVPAVNQMEFHPYLIQQDLLDLCAKNNILYQAWSPIMQGRVLDINLLKEIGARHNKSAVQVVLRWDLQRGVATIPKSVKRERIASNADIFDFELTPEEMAAINKLDRNERFGYDPMLV